MNMGISHHGLYLVLTHPYMQTVSSCRLESVSYTLLAFGAGCRILRARRCRFKCSVRRNALLHLLQMWLRRFPSLAGVADMMGPVSACLADCCPSVQLHACGHLEPFCVQIRTTKSVVLCRKTRWSRKQAMSRSRSSRLANFAPFTPRTKRHRDSAL